jgi:DNA-binding MarR family transcriptional regulator
MKDIDQRNSNWQDSLEPFLKELEECKKKLHEDIFLSFIYAGSFLATSVQRYVDSSEIKRTINRKDFRVLHSLIMHGGRAKPTEISKSIMRSKCAVSRVIDSLEIRGFVKREPFGDDLRTRDVVVTKKGVEVTNTYTEYVREFVIPKVLDKFSHEQKKDLQILLTRINSFLSQNINNSKSTKLP